jgi:hypothetical protein
VDVCGSATDDGDDRVGDGGDGCSALLTPSSRGIGVPAATMPLLLAAINASCGGGCMLVPVRGMGILCPVGQCGEATGRAAGGVAVAAAAGVPWGMPNLTFTFDASPAPDGGGCSSDEAPAARRARSGGGGRRRLGIGRDGDSPDDGGGGSDSDMWDVTLTPADFTQQLSAPHVRALLLSELERLAGGAHHPPRGAAAAAVAAALARLSAATGDNDSASSPRGESDGSSNSSSYYRVLLSPFLPLVEGDSAWVLGVPFLQALYTVYDGAGMQVGLAAAIEGHAPQPSRYNAASDAGWSGFFGSRAMWVTVGSVYLIFR